MSISRRNFLKGAAVGTLAAGTAKAGGTKHFPGYADRKGLLHDSTLCVGCRSCEFACNQVNELETPAVPVDDKAIFDKQRGLSENLYTVVNRYQEADGRTPPVYRKHQCMHCNEPCCASVCFVKAFVKTPEGPVLYKPDLCVGCRYCVFACPYYALAYEYDKALEPRVVRCTMCYDEETRTLDPKCAKACPTGAILYGRRDELLKLARERIRKYPGKYIDHIFGEKEWGGTSWLTLAGVPMGKLGLPENSPWYPLPDLTTSFLSLAPLVAALFPGLLAGVYAFSRRKDKLAQHERDQLITETRAAAADELERKLSELQAREERLRDKAVEQAVKTALEQARAAEAAQAEQKKEEDK